MEYELSIRDYLEIVKRRFLYFLLPFVLVMIAGIFVTLKLPARYRASGLILVESQQIPTDLIQSTVTGLADERIQIIKQRVMTRQNLSRIIEQFDLFADESARTSLSERIDTVKSNIAIDLVSAKTGERRVREATIAFSLSYEHESAKQSLNVVNELVTLFLDENVRTRTARASETTDFLAGEGDKLKRALEQLETRVADFKRSNANALPENLTLNLNLLERSEEDLTRIESDRKALEEELRFLKIELAAAQSGTGRAQSDASSLSPSQQLSQARSSLVDLQTRYADQHPDVKAAKDRIRALEGQITPTNPRQIVERELIGAKARLSTLIATASGGDARIADARQTVTELENRLKILPQTAPGSVDASGFDLQTARLEGQIAATEARIAVFNQARSELLVKVEDLQTRVRQTPEVERGLTSLMRDYENSLTKYEEIKSKQLEAQLAENLEEGKKAERFLLIEPPVLPTEPTSPNRPALFAASVGLALVLGGAALVVSELLLGGVSSPSVLSQITQQPLLTVIPIIKTKAEIARSRLRLYLLAAGCVTVPAFALVMVHVFHTRLDLLWYRILGTL